MQEHFSINKYRKLIVEYNLKTSGKGKGKNIYLHCPFHEDNKPSMIINKENGLFNCFNPNCQSMKIKDGRSQDIEFFKWLLENIEEQYKY